MKISNKFLCILGVLDEESQDVVANINKELYTQGFVGKQTKGIPQHITLGYYSLTDTEETISLMNDACNIFDDIALKFNFIGLFGLNVLFFGPAISKELLNLYTYLNKNNEADIKGWTPHSTLLIDAPDNVMKALPIINDHFEAFSGSICRLCLYEFFPPRLVYEINLS